MRVPHVSIDRSRAGFTILELVFALLLITVVLLAVGMNFLDFSRAFSSMAKIVHSRSRAQTIADRMVNETFGAQLTSITPSNPVNSPWVGFKRITGVKTDGSPEFGNTHVITLWLAGTEDPTNNSDDDGDGLVDEGAILFYEDLPPLGLDPNDIVVTLTDKAKKEGLKFTLDGTHLKIDMTLQEVIENGKDVKDTKILTGVKLRN